VQAQLQAKIDQAKLEVDSSAAAQMSVASSATQSEPSKGK
jgi:hypothetical protein